MKELLLQVLKFLLPCEIEGSYYEPHWIYKATHGMLNKTNKNR